MRARRSRSAGILAPTATPVDRALYITLLGEEAMHFGWSDGTPPAIGEATPALDPSKLKVDQITSFLLGTKSRISTLYLQREINTYKPEPLTVDHSGVHAAGAVEPAGLRGYGAVAGVRGGAGGGSVGDGGRVVYGAE